MAKRFVHHALIQVSWYSNGIKILAKINSFTAETKPHAVQLAHCAIRTSSGRSLTIGWLSHYSVLADTKVDYRNTKARIPSNSITLLCPCSVNWGCRQISAPFLLSSLQMLSS